MVKGKLDLSKLKKADLIKLLNILIEEVFNGYSKGFIDRITKIKGVRFVEEKR